MPPVVVELGNWPWMAVIRFGCGRLTDDAVKVSDPVVRTPPVWDKGPPVVTNVEPAVTLPPRITPLPPEMRFSVPVGVMRLPRIVIPASWLAPGTLTDPA